MAQAWVRFVSTAAPSLTTQAFYYAVTFFGPEVREEITTGKQQEVVVLLNTGFTLTDLKAGMQTAVQAKAAELGLTVAVPDIYLETLETGTVPL